jgi:hypothetical protein
LFFETFPVFMDVSAGAGLLMMTHEEKGRTEKEECKDKSELKRR